MSEKKLLKNCPFCGGEAKIEWESWPEIAPTIGTYRLSVNHALDCMFVRMNGTNYKSEMISNSKEQLAETWNTRKPMERIVERLEEEAKQYNSLGDRAKEKGYCHEYASQCYGNVLCYEDAIDIVKEEGDRMTEQEAKGFIQGKLDCMDRCDVFDCKGTDECDNCVYCYSQGNFGEQKKAFAMAIKSMEKQIPKKPLYGTVNRDDAVHCPSCGKFVCFRGAKEYNYCPKCGQAIDWSEEE